jgi:hypothetical protein
MWDKVELFYFVKRGNSFLFVCFLRRRNRGRKADLLGTGSLIALHQNVHHYF